MAEKILYLLGAGASAEAMPLVKINTTTPNPNIKKAKELPVAMREVAVLLTAQNNQIIKTIEQAKFYKEIADDLNDFAQKSTQFTTIDTYAKFLYLTDKKRFERLKYVLSVYFAIEQKVHKKLDGRYLVWLTSILDKLIFPDNVNILSWNYDFQLQETAKIFGKTERVHKSANGVAVKNDGLLNYHPASGRIMPVEHSKFSLLHLNGIAGFYYNSDMNYHVFLEDEMNSPREYLNRLMECEGHSRLTFAWENEQFHEKMKVVDMLVKDVTILVVIGYSFPFFNRNIDMEVYKRLRSYGQLRKIYFQDPFRDGKFLYNQFGIEKNIPIEHIPDVSSFLIPFEL